MDDSFEHPDAPADRPADPPRPAPQTPRPDAVADRSWMMHPPVEPVAHTADVPVADPRTGANPIRQMVTPGLGRSAVQASRPVVTYTLMALCALVYLAQWLLPATTDLGLFYALGGYVEPWRFLTSAFLHSPETPTHLLFNMMGLYAMGQFLEPFFGRARFAAIYLLSAVGGSVGFLLSVPTLDPSDQSSIQPWLQTMVGASGAVFGLFAAAFLVMRRVGSPVGGMVVLLALNLALPFFYPNIAWQAHLGGAVVGAIATAAVLATASPSRRRLQWSALATVAILVVAAAMTEYGLNATALDLFRPYL